MSHEPVHDDRPPAGTGGIFGTPPTPPGRDDRRLRYAGVACSLAIVALIIWGIVYLAV